MAKMALNPKDKARVAKIRNRVKDVLRNQAEDIRDGRFIRFTSHVFLEMRFLLDLIEGIKSSEPETSKKKGKKAVEPPPDEEEIEESELEEALA